MALDAERRALVGALRALPLALALALVAGPGAARCRLALAVGLDVSGSVDAREFRLEMEGMAQALLAPRVMRALLSRRDRPVAILVYVWAAEAEEILIADWTLVTDHRVLVGLADRIRNWQRRPRGRLTALGPALGFAASALAVAPPCERHVVDIAGDGRANAGPRPRELRHLLPAGTTVNALAIGPPLGATLGPRDDSTDDLAAYFEAELLSGPLAFVERAEGFENFAAAMTRKLERELSPPALSALRPERGPHPPGALPPGGHCRSGRRAACP